MVSYLLWGWPKRKSYLPRKEGMIFSIQYFNILAFMYIPVKNTTHSGNKEPIIRLNSVSSIDL